MIRESAYYATEIFTSHKGRACVSVNVQTGYATLTVEVRGSFAKINRSAECFADLDLEPLELIWEYD